METYVMLLAQGLANRSQQTAGGDLQVEVVTPTPADGMDDTSLPFRVVRQPGFTTLFRLLGSADVVHLAGPCFLPLLLSLAFRKPVVVEHHGYQAVCPNGLLLFEPTKTVCTGHFAARRYHKCLQCNASNRGWIRSILDLLLAFPRRWACRRVNLNLPIAQHVSNRIGLPRSKVIYYGIPDPLEGTGSYAADHTKGGVLPVTFACVGRLVSEKGLDLLVEAARRLKAAGATFRLKFIGDGPERTHLEEKVESSGLRDRIAFTGYLQGEVLEKALSDVRAVVMPSIWEETAGLSAMEQMMRGRLVIASDVGGLAEVVGGAGMKFPCGDVEHLTACLRLVLDEPEVVERLGREARSRAAELFTQQRMVTDHLDIFRQLTVGGSGA